MPEFKSLESFTYIYTYIRFDFYLTSQKNIYIYIYITFYFSIKYLDIKQVEPAVTYAEIVGGHGNMQQIIFTPNPNYINERTHRLVNQTMSPG